VSVPQAASAPAASRLAAETSSSWLVLLNFMRIFRQRAANRGAQSIRFGIEDQGNQVIDLAFGCVLEDCGATS